ncbi:unnamed protein product [Linum trigynum]|uniref:Uncharacterized protein n=1 Tax=Linum trigynum TaxID=586398 RepID=A0AAV2FH31_9ROSI
MSYFGILRTAVIVSGMEEKKNPDGGISKWKSGDLRRSDSGEKGCFLTGYEGAGRKEKWAEESMQRVMYLSCWAQT